MLTTDKRTNTGLTSNQATNYFHGLGKVPDEIKIRFIATLATNTNWSQIVAQADVTAVTLQNIGATTSPNFEVVASVLHSLIV